MITEAVENSRHMHYLQWEFISHSGRALGRSRRATLGCCPEARLSPRGHGPAGSRVGRASLACAQPSSRPSARLGCSMARSPPRRGATFGFQPIAGRASENRTPREVVCDGVSRHAPRQNPRLGGNGRVVEPIARSLLWCLYKRRGPYLETTSKHTLLHSVYRPCRPGQTVLVD
jgi:hypothetical protein